MLATREEVRDQGELEVEIDDFGFTGEGYVRLEDGWLSVYGALPGERVRVRVQPGQREGARRIYADLVEVLEASADRRDPLCEFDRVCRGCQLRHLTVAAELRFKVRTVREVIEKYGGLGVEEQPPIEVVTPQPTSRGDAYRMRAGLSYRRVGEKVEVGLYSPASEELVPMEHCPALTPPVQRLIGVVRKSLDAQRVLPWDERMVREVSEQVSGFAVNPGVKNISVAAPTHGVGFVDVALTPVEGEAHFREFVQDGAISNWLKELAEMVPKGVGISVHSDSFRDYVKEPRRIRVPIGRWRMEAGYDDWFHANVEPAEAVYEHLMGWMSLDREMRVLDVGCGTGTISLMVSREVKEVLGIDANRSSIAAAENNALAHGRENVHFVAGGWEKGLRRLMMKGAKFDVATVNPMREPLGRRPLALMKALGIKEIFYLGPSPESASRDIGALREMGWSVERLGAGNLHPATYHTFLMAHLKIKNERDFTREESDDADHQ